MKKSGSKYFKFLFFVLALTSFVGCGKEEKPIVAPEAQPQVTPYRPVDQFANASAREAVRDQNRELVRACYDEKESSTLVAVNYVISDNHHRTLPRRRSVKYKINTNLNDSRLGIGIKIALATSLASSPPTPRQLEMLNGVRACVPKIRNVFARYGIDLSLQLDLVQGDRTVLHEQRVVFTDGIGRSSTDIWFYQGTGTTYPVRDETCLTILHELGHYLSLDDEYPDSNFPGRPFIAMESNPVSIMRSADAGFEYSDFYPRHIQSMLAPACPEFARQQGWVFPSEMRHRVL